jgi:hypothetical protein
VATVGLYLLGAGLLLTGGILKALRPAGTALAFAAAWPRTPPRLWPPAVMGFALLEATLGAVALAEPGRILAVAVAVSYLSFAAWVLWARARGGPLATCGCFATPDTPPTVLHAALDAVLALGAAGVAASAPSGSILPVLSRQYLDGGPLLAACVVAGGLSYVVMSPLARLGAAAGTSRPAGFGVASTGVASTGVASTGAGQAP